MGEGDGTVSLLSLGAMCVEGWKRERWNPAGIKVITVEVHVQSLPCDSTMTEAILYYSFHINLLSTTPVEELILATTLIS